MSVLVTAAAVLWELLPAASPSPAHYSGSDDIAMVAVLSGLFSLLGATASLVAALVWGRKGAPRAPWKRSLAVVFIVFASLSTLWNVAVMVLSLWVGLALASSSETLLVVFVVLGVCGVPLAVALGVLFASVRLYRRNPGV